MRLTVSRCSALLHPAKRTTAAPRPTFKLRQPPRPAISLLSITTTFTSRPSLLHPQLPFPALTRYLTMSSSHPHYVLPPVTTLSTITHDPTIDRTQQDPLKINALINDLKKGANNSMRSKTSFAAKKTSFETPAGSVDSWKFPEHAFKKLEMPTNARGLFTWRDEKSGNHRIAARGYDKFFNINEVQRTKWDWIEAHTKGPYELTVKENGCIIFISGLGDGTLLVCSKHSLGSPHAQVGLKWVDEQLARLGRKREDLALALFKANATAVAELCDDSFEEHILEYEGENAGLYLHGINLNLPTFATYPMTEVEKFGNEWGFRKIDHFVKHDVKEMREFLEGAAETGSWDGKDVEGFVIRCKSRFGPEDPYWHDWFFKFKFDEPYLLYRQWRECTKALIAGRNPTLKKNVAITSQYLKFAQRYFIEHPGAAKEYQNNHGIITLRKAFLDSAQLSGGDIIRKTAEEEKEISSRVVLVPVATIGCGKTTVAYALTHLFNWGHKQNDNVTVAKGKPAAFARLCVQELTEHPVVIADRNNHMRREREQIINDIQAVLPDARFIALNYVHYDDFNGEETIEKIREATRKRVFDRGDNHQTIHAAAEDKGKILSIMEGFIDRFEPVDREAKPDDSFDLIIDLDPCAESRQNLETVVKTLHQHYPKLVPKIPSPAELDAAIKAAFEDYTPETKHKVGGSNNKKQKATSPKSQQNQQQKSSDNHAQSKKEFEYFALTIPSDTVRTLLDRTFASHPQSRAFYDHLLKTSRVQPSFHVTLMHRASIPENPTLWGRYVAIQKAGEFKGEVEVRLKNVCWNEEVMAIEVELPEGWESANKVAHVTVGTRDSRVKPVASNGMLVGKYEKVEIEGDGMVKGVKTVVKPNGRR